MLRFLHLVVYYVDTRLHARYRFVVNLKMQKNMQKIFMILEHIKPMKLVLRTRVFYQVSFVHFFEYFKFCEERNTSMNTARVNRMRNVRVNRSMIGQQAALSETNTAVTLNPTTAQADRERGSGEIAGDITINEISQQSSESSNTARFPRHTLPYRRTAPNDGRRGQNRARNFNMQFSPSLPPSTGSARTINLDRMEMGYTSIAESINNLAYQ